MSAKLRLPVLIALLCLMLPHPGPAAETMWREPLWLQPPGADAPLPALLSLPTGWLLGDAVAVLLPDRHAPGPLRYRVMEALLAADAAVLELDPAASTSIPGVPPAAPLDPPEWRPVLREALRALRVEAGAGLIVAIGLGAGGEAALWAAEGSAEGWILPGLAGAAALGGPGPARFRAGALPPAAQQWPVRARLFCGLLAGLAGGAEARRRCEDALLAPPLPLLAAWEP